MTEEEAYLKLMVAAEERHDFPEAFKQAAVTWARLQTKYCLNCGGPESRPGVWPQGCQCWNDE